MTTIMNKKQLYSAIITIAITTSLLVVSCAYAIKPEIKHKFREPEERPSAIVTTFFIGLVASPITLLFAIWSKSVKFSSDKLTIGRILFHIGFLLILVQIAKFWWQ